MALVNFVSLVRRWDIETALALKASRGSEHRAAVSLGISSAALRQRVTRLVLRIEGAFPDFRFKRGAQSETMYGHDLDLMGESHGMG